MYGRFHRYHSSIGVTTRTGAKQKRKLTQLTSTIEMDVKLIELS